MSGLGLWPARVSASINKRRRSQGTGVVKQWQKLALAAPLHIAHPPIPRQEMMRVMPMMMCDGVDHVYKLSPQAESSK